MSIEEIYHDSGIATILAALKAPMEQKTIYQKRNHSPVHQPIQEEPAVFEVSGN